MEQWGGLCCTGAAALYLLSRRTARDVDFLTSATRVDHLKDLESSKVLTSMIIAVSGVVGSETPIKCEHSDILAVILQETAAQHFLKRNWKFSWVQDTAFMLPVSKEVPWFLDDGTGRVIVEGAQSAIGFALTPGGEVLEKPEPSSLLRGTLDFLRGLKMLGIRRVERVLPIGTPLTVVGQTIKDGVGDVKIQKPDQGRPFYVSPIPLDQLISNAGKWSRRFKKASMGLAIVGVILISMPVIQHILMRTGDLLETRRQQRLLQRRRDADAASNRERAAAGREEVVAEEELENSLDGRSTDDDDLCIICIEHKCDAIFIPCGHMCCCLTCSLMLEGKPCPLCRGGDLVVKVIRN